MNEQEFEEARKHLLFYLDGLRKNVERAVDLKGDWKIEKPSLHQVSQNPLPPMLKGSAHTRYTLTIDLLESQFTTKDEET